MERGRKKKTSKLGKMLKSVDFNLRGGQDTLELSDSGLHFRNCLKIISKWKVFKKIGSIIIYREDRRDYNGEGSDSRLLRH